MLTQTDKKRIVLSAGIVDDGSMPIYDDDAEFMGVEIDEKGYRTVSEMIRRFTTGESGSYLPVELQVLAVDAKFPGKLVAIEDDGSEDPDYLELANLMVLETEHLRGWRIIEPLGQVGDQVVQLAVDTENGGWQMALILITKTETPYMAEFTRYDWDNIGHIFGWN